MSSSVVSGETSDANTSLTSLSVKSAIHSGPRRSTHIRARLFFTTLRPAVRVHPNHDNLQTTSKGVGQRTNRLSGACLVLILNGRRARLSVIREVFSLSLWVCAIFCFGVR